MKTFAALALTLTAALAPAAGFAQSSLGSVQIPSSGVAYVIEHCEDLADMDHSDRFDHSPSFADNVRSGIALHTVRLADCRRAGFV